MKYVHNREDIPKEKHLAAIVFDSIYVPGDERSRTHAGHGYPGGTEQKLNYIVFTDKQDCEKWIGEQESRKYGSPTPYVIIEANKLGVETKISVKF